MVHNCDNQTVFCCEGGILTSIENPAEQQFIQGNVEIFKDGHSAFWVGMYKTHNGMIALFSVLYLKGDLCNFQANKQSLFTHK